MLIINGNIQIQESGGIFERSYNIRGAIRRCIEIHIDNQENITYEFLNQLFSDGTQIIKREIKTYIESVLVKEATETEEAVYEDEEKTETKDYPLTDYVVAGDIIDKRDGTFIVYMGQKTEAEILNEEMAELLLEMAGV